MSDAENTLYAGAYRAAAKHLAAWEDHAPVVVRTLNLVAEAYECNLGYTASSELIARHLGTTLRVGHDAGIFHGLFVALEILGGQSGGNARLALGLIEQMRSLAATGAERSRDFPALVGGTYGYLAGVAVGVMTVEAAGKQLRHLITTLEEDGYDDSSALRSLHGIAAMLDHAIRETGDSAVVVHGEEDAP